MDGGGPDEELQHLTSLFYSQKNYDYHEILESIEYYEEPYIPLWFRTLRGFVDLGRLQNERILDMIEKNVPSDVVNWDYSDENEWIFEYPEIIVRIKVSSGSSSFLLPIDIVNREYGLERKFIDPIRSSIRDMVKEQGPQMTTFYDFAFLILRVLEELSSYLVIRRADPVLTEVGKGWDASQVKNWEDVVDNPFGVDLRSIKQTAQYILQKTPEQICAKISPHFRVLHVESVLRTDLVDRFFRCRAKMRRILRTRNTSELARSTPREIHQHEDMVDFLTKTRVTFHGTTRNVVRSIVRYGFVKPGENIGNTGAKLGVRCGNTYGCGIYSSPDPNFSLAYTGYLAEPTEQKDIPSLKLIVCATLMGRTARVTRDDNWREHSEPMDRADSHVSNLDLEYVVFDSAQILPCYVIHLDLGAAVARRMLEATPAQPAQWAQQQQRARLHPKLVQQTLYPGDIERIKQAKQAAAAKWFPYGYGPARGTEFVIEEIGEVDDDEEDYGEYQGERIEQDDDEEWEDGDAGLAADANSLEFWRRYWKEKKKSKMNKAADTRVGGGDSIFDEYFDLANYHPVQDG